METVQTSLAAAGAGGDPHEPGLTTVRLATNVVFFWSGRRDLNPRPQRPERYPGIFVCAVEIAKPQVRGYFLCPPATAADHESPNVCGRFVVDGDGDDVRAGPGRSPRRPCVGFRDGAHEDVVEPLRHRVAQRREQVAVDVHRHGDRPVPEPLLDQLRVRTELDQQ